MAQVNTNIGGQIDLYRGAVQVGLKTVKPVFATDMTKIPVVGTQTYTEYEMGNDVIKSLEGNKPGTVASTGSAGNSGINSRDDGEYVKATSDLSITKLDFTVRQQFYSKRILTPLIIKQSPIRNILQRFGTEQGKKFRYHREDVAFANILKGISGVYSAAEKAFGFTDPVKVFINSDDALGTNITVGETASGGNGTRGAKIQRKAKTEAYGNALYDAIVSLSDELRTREIEKNELCLVLRTGDLAALVKSKYVSNRDFTKMAGDTVGVTLPELAGLTIKESPRFNTWTAGEFTAGNGKNQSFASPDTTLIGSLIDYIAPDKDTGVLDAVGIMYKKSDVLDLETIGLMSRIYDGSMDSDMLSYALLTAAYNIQLRRKDHAGFITLA